MKLVRYGRPGKEKPGLIDGDGKLRDLSGRIDDITPDQLSDKALAKLARINPDRLPLVRGKPRFGPPLTGIGNFVCVGLNYTDHAEETGHPIPTEPVIFSKHTSCIAGAYDDVVLPKKSVKTDWEVELGVVVSKPAKYVDEADAMDYVAGYCVINDVSERAYQIEHEGQWTKGKSCDNFGQTGPFLVTPDEAGDPQNLSMWLDVNGERVQDGSTKTMVYGVAHLVSYLSRFMTLEPGDIISTGTPPGVGLGFTPPRYLKAGDVVELGIKGLGQQKQVCVSDD